MRLPYLQVTDETWAKARMLGGLLGVDRRHAFGLICDLWAWGLELGPRNAPPTGEATGPLAKAMLAGALEWTGNVPRLVEALEAVGLISADESLVRVRGLDRYASTWRRNRRTTGGPPADHHDIATVDGDGDGDRKEAFAGSPPKAAEPPVFKLEEQRAKKPKTLSPQQRLAEKLIEQRNEALGPDETPDKEHGAARINTMLEKLVEFDEPLILQAHWLYCQDIKRRSQSPPCRLDYFSKDWPEYVDRARKEPA